MLADGRIEGRWRTPLGLGVEGGEFSQSQGAPGTHLGAHQVDDGIKALLLEVNICDDLFKERKRSRDIQQARDDAERESYTAKHDLVNMQMKLETTLRELENTQKKLAELEAKQAAQDARDRALASTKK